MKYRYRIPTVILLGFFLVAVASPVVAQGGQESGPPEETTETERKTDQPWEEIHRKQRELLTAVGIRAFEGAPRSVDFSLPLLGDGEETLSRQRGTLVFLNFWASWCPPCREEMPSMETMQAQLDDVPFSMLAVNVREDRNTVQRFIREYGYSFPVLLDSDGSVTTRYGVRGLPTTYFISQDGTMLGMLVGILDWADEEVSSIIREAALLGDL